MSGQDMKELKAVALNETELAAKNYMMFRHCSEVLFPVQYFQQADLNTKILKLSFNNIYSFKIQHRKDTVF